METKHVSEFPADIRNRMGFIKFYKQDALDAVNKYINESADLYSDILKELQLDGNVADTQGNIGHLIVLRNKPFDIVFKANESSLTYAWAVKDDIYDEIKHLTENFTKA